MASFDDWYQWATAQGGGWTKVAGNARREARYAKPDAMGDFQTAVGVASPQTEELYSQVCLPHHLQGDKVAAEHLAPYLTRMVDEGHLDYALERALAGSTLPTPKPARASKAKWAAVSEFLSNLEDADAPIFVPAAVKNTKESAARAVFAAFDENDQPPQNGQPTPAFLDRVRADHGSSMTVADYAVYRLATGGRPTQQQPVRTKVLLYYPRDRAGTAHFPVPADAEWHSRFRAIAPQDPHYCGRTFPDGSDPAEHAKGICGENEVVHDNRGLPWSEVFVISLGETSCAGV